MFLLRLVSEPGAWHPPKYQTADCPPQPASYEGSLAVVGRTMFETDRLPQGWVDRLNRMTEAWVPTQFHREVFETAGVQNVHVVPEAVDTEFFSPDSTSHFEYPKEETKVFRFLSVFKFEERKAWDVLVEAFVREFGKSDSVVLVILTSSFHSDREFDAHIQSFIRSLDLPEHHELPPIRVITDVPQHQMPGLYKGADAFVLPSRGEGWGRPHVEAMASGLPGRRASLTLDFASTHQLLLTS